MVFHGIFFCNVMLEKYFPLNLIMLPEYSSAGNHVEHGGMLVRSLSSLSSFKYFVANIHLEEEKVCPPDVYKNFP